MRNMRFKVGDRVRIKSLDWYNDNKDEYGDVKFLIKEMSEFCGEIMTIKHISGIYYIMEESDIAYGWTDEMIEGLVEEPIILNGKEVLLKLADIELPSGRTDIWECPEGYQFKDENGNVINATKIFLEKKKKEYPKTLGECRVILGMMSEYGAFNYKANLITTLISLLICRDAYWKIAGEEMGLGKPWKPDWTTNDVKHSLVNVGNTMIPSVECKVCRILVFPTKEMRDTFFEYFEKQIKLCKELL